MWDSGEIWSHDTNLPWDFEGLLKFLVDPSGRQQQQSQSELIFFDFLSCTCSNHSPHLHCIFAARLLHQSDEIYRFVLHFLFSLRRTTYYSSLTSWHGLHAPTLNSLHTCTTKCRCSTRHHARLFFYGTSHPWSWTWDSCEQDTFLRLERVLIQTSMKTKAT